MSESGTSATRGADAETSDAGRADAETGDARRADAGTDEPGANGTGTADTAADDAGMAEGDADPMDRSPTYLSSALALAAGILTATAGFYSPAGLAVCVAGVLVLAAGLAVGRQVLVTLAAGAFVVGVVLGGTAGAPVLATLVGVAAALLAFDLGSTAVGLGAQLGREAPTRRVELVHAAASTLVGLGFVLAGFAIHESVTGGPSVSTVLGLVIAAVVLIAALRRSDPVADG